MLTRIRASWETTFALTLLPSLPRERRFLAAIDVCRAQRAWNLKLESRKISRYYSVPNFPHFSAVPVVNRSSLRYSFLSSTLYFYFIYYLRPRLNLPIRITFDLSLKSTWRLCLLRVTFDLVALRTLPRVIRDSESFRTYSRGEILSLRL